MKSTIYIIFAVCFALSSLHAAVDKPLKSAQGKEAVLQAKLALTPNKILPGSSIDIKAIVKNSGKVPSRPAKLQVRYALPKPLQKNPKSILFETEIVNLPKIEPGQEHSITFETQHLIPTVGDYIKYDWPMRQYQVVLLDGEKDEKEYILGTLAISISAYYYEGPAKSVRVPIP